MGSVSKLNENVDEVAPDDLQAIRNQLEPRMQAIVDKLASKAEGGNIAATKLAMLYFLPPSAMSHTRVYGLGTLAKMPPDQRVAEIQKRVLKGAISLEAAETLTDMATRQIESGVVQVIRDLTARLRRGESYDSVISDLQAVEVREPVEIKPTRNFGPPHLTPALRAALQ